MLRTGDRVLIRPIRPGDREDLLDGVPAIPSQRRWEGDVRSALLPVVHWRRLGRTDETVAFRHGDG